MIPKISIIISVYNKLEQLKNILIILNEQTILPDEVIIVDDGSSEKIDEKLKDTIPKIKYKLKHIWQEDKGFRLSASRNNGILNASGDYLLFLDQDLIFDKDFIKNIKQSIKKGQALKIRATYFDKERTDKINEIILKNGLDFEKIKKFLTFKEKFHLRKRYIQDTAKNILFKYSFRKRTARIAGLGIGILKEDILKINGFDEKFIGWGLEDFDLGNRINGLGLGITTIKPKNIVIHMYHPVVSQSSVNESYFDKRQKEILEEGKYICEYGCNKRLDEEDLKIKELN